LIARIGARLHSLFWNGQQGRGNTVLGPLWHHVTGPKAIVETSGEVRLFYPPGAFGQSHLELAEKLATRVSHHVPSDARIAEFYAGVGALGLPLALRSQVLHVNEISEGSLAGLNTGIAELDEREREKVRVHAGSATEHVALLRDVDLAIVDPPRKGLDRELLEALVANPPSRLIYVSCGLASLIEQSQTLVDSRRWKMSVLEAFALFPYTEHVEALAVFDRVG
jgi:tRNA/tmRNA/rRNA uracil-C5-methylase (TrmA/RlmC/RlmD family)